MLAGVKKEEIVKKFGRSGNDTGSSEVQIAMLTERINQISEHLKSFVKDNHSRRGLIKLVSRREDLISYLKKNDYKRYEFILDNLGLRR